MVVNGYTVRMIDPFATFDLPRRFDIDVECLSHRFIALCAEHHPDRFTDPIDQVEASERTARINESHRVLTDPEQRANILLQLLGGAAKGDDKSLPPDLLVDARVLKHGHDTRIEDARWVVGVGPGFRPGRDCHAAVETVRGHDLGRVLHDGETLPFDGEPGELGGARSARVLRAPGPGRFAAVVAIGDRIAAGARVGTVGGWAVRSPIGGVVRGLIAEGCQVRQDQKVGDVDPRDDPSLCESLSDKANAVGGGVVEAVLALLAGRATLRIP